LIVPPTWLTQITNAKSLNKVLPPGQLTHTHWRRQGVKYSNNGTLAQSHSSGARIDNSFIRLFSLLPEIFIDMAEDINCIVDKNGTVITAGITVAFFLSFLVSFFFPFV
jgi:hypothetical protein